MDDLIKIISEGLNIPYIEEEDAIIDGSFGIEPWMSSALIADGQPQNITDNMTVYLYFTTKSEAIAAVHTLWPILTANHIAVSQPDYTWQEGGSLWMASLRIEK